jgi:hypothetical protein
MARKARVGLKEKGARERPQVASIADGLRYAKTSCRSLVPPANLLFIGVTNLADVVSLHSSRPVGLPL